MQQDVLRFGRLDVKVSKAGTFPASELVRGAIPPTGEAMLDAEDRSANRVVGQNDERLCVKIHTSEFDINTKIIEIVITMI
ncbi:predicted protein [Histoplasma mississippiense (nom. inval.)]|uniref:predicted protein n=1 Tax=Ajellomyces capsulatus (strain NAm1 / WU24) TaxID=2059318 RepID=UPI000157B71D|nr:predicted protein [Histoplasma mississippiense (nom. inval.)]EDN03416.1 predicted protein [Histoplasma mississippiense (nom. inval.)]